MIATMRMMKLRAVKPDTAPHTHTPELHQGDCSLKITVYNQLDYHIHILSLHPSVSNASGSSLTSGQLAEQERDVGEMQILEMTREDVYRTIHHPLPQGGSQDSDILSEDFAISVPYHS